jgi:hypothetical protein
VDSDPTLIARLEGRKRMKRTVCALATAAALGLGTVALSGPALADGARTATGGLPARAYGWGFGYGYYGNGRPITVNTPPWHTIATLSLMNILSTLAAT